MGRFSGENGKQLNRSKGTGVPYKRGASSPIFSICPPIEVSKTKKTLSIEGMHCDHCVDTVRDALEDLEGLSVQSVSIGEADVTYDSSNVSVEDVSTALEEAGYELSS